MSTTRAWRLLTWFALGLVLVLVAASLWLHGPQVEADEGSYLLSAATIAGKLNHAVAHGYYSGYSVFLAPALLLWSDPIRSYHTALVINALLLALLPFALYRLARLLRPELDPRWPLLAAIAATCYAPTLTLSQYTMSDNALVPLYACMLACAATALHRTRVLPAIAAGGLAAALMLVHPRGAVIALPVLVVFSLTAVRRSEIRLAFGSMWLMMFAVVALHAPLEHLAGKAGTLNGSYAPPTAMLARFATPSTWLWVATNAVGATTTAIVTSLGVLVLAAIAFLDSMRRFRLKNIFDMPLATTVMLACALGMGAALITTAVFFTPPTRADQIAYGRYALPALVPLLTIGLLRFAAPPERRSLDGMWTIGAGCIGVAVMGFAFLFIPHSITGSWVFINAVALDLAQHALPLGNAWLSIGLFFIASATLLYAISRRSGYAAITAYIFFNIGLATVGWLFVTRPLSVVYSSNRPVVEAAAEFERLTGTPLCVQLDHLDDWNSLDIAWRLFPQIPASPLIDRHRCVQGVIRPLTLVDGPRQMRLVATERGSPLDQRAIGLFIEPGAALDVYARVRHLPPEDAITPLPASDRRATIKVQDGDIPTRILVGTTVKATALITNRGHMTWTPTSDRYLPFPIRLGAQATNEAIPTDVREYRSELPEPLKAGATAEATFKIGPFDHPGRYRVRIGILQEHLAWFDGAANVEIDVSAQ